MKEYDIPLEKVQKAGIKPEVGSGLVITLTGGKKVPAKITKVDKDKVFVTTK